MAPLPSVLPMAIIDTSDAQAERMAAIPERLEAPILEGGPRRGQHHVGTGDQHEAAAPPPLEVAQRELRIGPVGGRTRAAEVEDADAAVAGQPQRVPERRRRSVFGRELAGPRRPAVI